MTFLHGTDAGYHHHSSHHIPFPEDTGGDPCGCRAAHNEAGRISRAARGEHSAKCPSCGHHRALTPGRNGLCTSCCVPPESPMILGGGTWTPTPSGIRRYRLPDGRNWTLRSLNESP